MLHLLHYHPYVVSIVHYTVSHRLIGRGRHTMYIARVGLPYYSTYAHGILYSAILTQYMDDNAVNEAWSLIELGPSNHVAGV